MSERRYGRINERWPEAAVGIVITLSSDHVGALERWPLAVAVTGAIPECVARRSAVPRGADTDVSPRRDRPRFLQVSTEPPRRNGGTILRICAAPPPFRHGGRIQDIELVGRLPCAPAHGTPTPTRSGPAKSHISRPVDCGCTTHRLRGRRHLWESKSAGAVLLHQLRRALRSLQASAC